MSVGSRWKPGATRDAELIPSYPAPGGRLLPRRVAPLDLLRTVEPAERTSCGLTLTARSLGVTHPVLPCGAKLLVRYGGETILTEVIDNELVATGRQFELTPALAQLVGLDGTQQVEWRYATRQ